jgi:hypothetical protein
MPSLCSTDTGNTSLRAPGEPSAFSLNFGTTNSEMPLVPCRRTGQPGEHEVDDVLGHGVITPRDVDLASGQQVTIARRFGLRRKRREVRSGLWLGEAHRARPLPRHELLQVLRCFSSSVAWRSIARMAPCDSSGHSAKATFAAAHISSQAIATVFGRPCPPNSGFEAMPGQPRLR